MCTNSSISAATRTQIFGHPGLNGLCLYYRKSTKIPHVSLLCRKGIGQMDFFGCIFCVQILTYICRSIFPKRKNERRKWHCLLVSRPVKKSDRKKNSVASLEMDRDLVQLSYIIKNYKIFLSSLQNPRRTWSVEDLQDDATAIFFFTIRLIFSRNQKKRVRKNYHGV